MNLLPNGTCQINGNSIFEWQNSESWRQYFVYMKGNI